MTRNLKHLITVIVLALLMSAGAFTYKAAGSIKKGNRLYEDGKPELALSEYEKVLEEDPDDPTALYNKAVVLYSAGEYGKAEDAFLRAMALGKKSVEKRTAYNIGNTKFREAERSAGKGRPPESYEQALEYYKRAMELDPEDLDAKYNYEITLKRMK
ncbi:MAG: tetratricopeptide repeat protein, partial [Candidatus Omnitrophica bacterium]|nr:tetratricopeptide repeat protein [Candidatus Omnitrophota bacterium]